MGQTIVEKIFTNKIGKRVFANDMVWSNVDLMMGTDGTVPMTISILEKNNINTISDSAKVVFVNDHFSPAKDIVNANTLNYIKKFANEYKVRLFDAGEGICHVLIPDKGLIKPGMLIVGADSHVCTYGALGALSIGIGSSDLAFAMSTGKLWFRVPETIKINVYGKKQTNISGKDIVLAILKKVGVAGASYSVIELVGEAMTGLNIADRFSMCNMAAEMGAKGVIIPYDEITAQYLKDKVQVEQEDVFYADKDAKYSKCIDICIDDLQPQIACPYAPDNVHNVNDMEGLKIDQIVIGLCTNGRLEDFRRASRYLKKKKINENVRLLIIPGSKEVLNQMIKEGIAEILVEAGGIICPSTCGPCVGGHMGVLGENEVGLYTSSRNFLGRCGDKTANVYLCSPDTAAYSALFGYIKEPPSQE